MLNGNIEGDDFRDMIKEPDEANHSDHCPEIKHSSNHETVDTDVVAHGEEEEGDKWMYILGHDGLKKRVIKNGENLVRPSQGQIATINCVGYLKDGKEIDKFDNLNLVIGDDEIIQAFDLCLPLMEKGEICELVSEARFAYGAIGRFDDIPPESPITYTIELLDMTDQLPFTSMPLSMRIALSDRSRERGNVLYSRKEYTRAINVYNRAIRILKDDDECHDAESNQILQQLIDTRLKCYNNLAATQMKVEAWDAAIKSCNDVLKIQTGNVKALFRKGKCLVVQNDIPSAIQCLKKALCLEPETKIIHQELSKLEQKNKANLVNEKNLYQRMLGTEKLSSDNKKKTFKMSGSAWYIIGGAAAAFLSITLGLIVYRS